MPLTDRGSQLRDEGAADEGGTSIRQRTPMDGNGWKWNAQFPVGKSGNSAVCVRGLLFGCLAPVDVMHELASN